MTALVTATQLLTEDFDKLSPQEMRERIAALHRDAFWLYELVENVLAAAMIHVGRLYLRRRRVSLEEVVSETSSIIGPILIQQGMRLETTLGEPIPAVDADPGRIGQVLLNLISNASRFSAVGEPAAVTVGVRGVSVRVSVADRGPALPEGDRVATRPNFDLGSVEETATIGLVVARWIVEAHGGQVGANNRRRGGARFWFELPGVVGSA